MKYIISLIIILQSSVTYSQCNCQSFTKNSISSTQCPIQPIGGDKSLQIGIGFAKSEAEKYVSVIIRFKSNAQNMTNNLSLTLLDGNIIELPLYQSKLGYVGNSEVSSGNFSVDDNSLKLLSKTPIKSISFYLEDNLKHILSVVSNHKIIINQIKCL